MMRKRLLLLAFLLLPAIAQPQSLSSLDKFVPLEMQKWKVPGVAIAIVQRDHVIYSHGFGLRDVKRNLPVTTKTLFAIGSITKSFTSLSMGILNDEGKLDWDKPVREYLPEFQMHDAEASERMTPRDLISHRTGFASHDMVWYSSNFSREELLHRLRFLQSNREFRSGYNYNNMLVMAAGYLVGKISGNGWETFVQQRIFQPLEMTHSNFTLADIQKSDDFAHPYIKDEDSGNVNETPFHSVENVCPAGCINSNIEDMARYTIFQLGKGKTGNSQIVSEANLNVTHSAQVPMSGPGEFKEIGAYSYGMGWVVTSYRGHRMIWHNGGIDGFYALLSMLPDDDTAVVILTNLQNEPVPEIVAYKVYDELLHVTPIDWSARYEQVYAKGKTAEEEAEKTEAAKRKSGTHPSHDLKEYTGDFENAGYGIFRIASAGDHFNANLNQMELPLQHYHFDVFQVPQKANWILGGLKVRFLTNMDGEIDSVAIPLEGDAPEIVFTRKGK